MLPFVPTLSFPIETETCLYVSVPIIVSRDQRTMSMCAHTNETCFFYYVYVEHERQLAYFNDEPPRESKYTYQMQR